MDTDPRSLWKNLVSGDAACCEKKNTKIVEVETCVTADAVETVFMPLNFNAPHMEVQYVQVLKPFSPLF